MTWMKRRRLILTNPLAEVGKVANEGVGGFRRALAVADIQKLLAKAPRHRAAVYQTMIYTGLCRAEVNGLKWGDFDLAEEPSRLKAPSSLSKNKKESLHYLRPELVETLKSIRPTEAKSEHWVFRGTVPRVPTFKRT